MLSSRTRTLIGCCRTRAQTDPDPVIGDNNFDAVAAMAHAELVEKIISVSCLPSVHCSDLSRLRLSSISNSSTGIQVPWRTTRISST